MEGIDAPVLHVTIRAYNENHADSHDKDTFEIPEFLDILFAAHLELKLQQQGYCNLLIHVKWIQ